MAGRMMRIAAVVSLAVAIQGGRAHADVKLPAVIGSHMVLQRDVEARVWGWADVGEQVTVTVGDKQMPTVTADAEGQWIVKVPAHSAGGPVRIVVQGNNTITLDNVLFGDVWVCSGQSNMTWQLLKSRNGKAEIAEADFPRIRLFTVPREPAGQPQEDCTGQWVECSPATIATFSGVAYFFGRHLHRELDVPIGLVHSSHGGTPVAAWTPLSVLQTGPDADTLFQRHRDYAARYPQALQNYEAAMEKWAQAASDARTQGNPEPPKPRKPIAPEKSPIQPAVLYNGMIHPLTTLTIKGAIWYQGENNVAMAHLYRQMLPRMIQGWRREWDQGDFPFGIVQLANCMDPESQPVESTWAELREAQAITARTVPNCGLAVTIDIGGQNIHPTNKQDVGKRLGLWALAKVYGQDVIFSGPEYDRMTVENSTIRITFKHTAGGLVVKDVDALKGFAIAGDDRKFVWADATIDGDTVIVRSPQVTQPVAVRYAWSNNPECNLYNKADLPAIPFRTDDWAGMTTGAKHSPSVD